MKQIIKYNIIFSYACLTIAAFGTIFLYGDFSKLQFGPFFMLEILTLLWGLGALFSNTLFLSPKGLKKENLKPLIFPFLFFAYGVLLASFDALSFFQTSPNAKFPTIMRYLQHCVLFVYPFVWAWMGSWLHQTQPKYAKIFFFTAVFASVIPNLYGAATVNISVGNLSAILYCWYLCRAKTKKDWLFCAGYGLLSYIPFWLMWYQQGVQRTSLVLVSLILLLTPILLRHYKKALISVGFLYIGFIILAGIKAPHKELDDALTKHIYSSLQHGEDLPDVGRPGNFQFRNRKYWWKIALSDWLKRPIVGIGFLPEVPSMAKEGKENDGRFENDPDFGELDAPISGPHNSYLSVLARTGVIGSLLFLFILIAYFMSAWRIFEQRSLGLIQLLLILVPLCGFVHAIVNIGFESPHNSALMWLFLGALYSEALVETRFKR